MKKKRISLFFIALILFYLCGCSNLSDSENFSSNEEYYTVWTDLTTYSEFKSLFNSTLDDGMYVRLEFTPAQWEQIENYATSEGQHYWAKDKIKDWLIGRGFGNYEASKESAWLTTINHGYIASRTGNTVYYIVK